MFTNEVSQCRFEHHKWAAFLRQREDFEDCVEDDRRPTRFHSAVRQRKNPQPLAAGFKGDSVIERKTRSRGFLAIDANTENDVFGLEVILSESSSGTSVDHVDILEFNPTIFGKQFSPVVDRDGCTSD